MHHRQRLPAIIQALTAVELAAYTTSSPALRLDIKAARQKVAGLLTAPTVVLPRLGSRSTRHWVRVGRRTLLRVQHKH